MARFGENVCARPVESGVMGAQIPVEDPVPGTLRTTKIPGAGFNVECDFFKGKFRVFPRLILR